MGSSAMDAMQVLFTAFDTGISSVWREEDRSWRSEERRWRTEDVDYREEERRWRAEEGEMRCNEQRYKTLNTTTTSTTTFVSIAAALSNPNNSIHLSFVMSKLMGMSLITLWVMGASLIDSFVSDDWWHTYKGFRVLTATHSFSCSKTINRFDVSGCMQFVITLLVHKLLFFSSESQYVKGSRYSFPALPELVLIALQICIRPSHLFSCWCWSSQNMSK